jgi:transposase
VAGVTFWNIYFKLVKGAVRAPEIVTFLKNLRRHLAPRKRLIIWDRLQAHRSRLVRDYVETEGDKIELEFLPPYAPQLNPVEYLWAHWKQHEMPNFRPKDFAELSAFARAKLKSTQRRITLVAAFRKQAELPF